MSTNIVALTGNLSSDYVERKAGSVYTFSLAFTTREKFGNDWQDHSNFINCVVFGQRGAVLAKYLRKGMRVTVQGSLKYESWKSKDGQNMHDLRLIVRELDFMEPKVKSQAQEDIELPFPV